MPARLYVLGRVWLETPDLLVSETDLPGRRCRVLLVALTVSRTHPVPRAVLAERLWGDRLPPAWEASMDALVSRLRRVLAAAFADGSAGVVTSGGCHRLRLPPDTVVDLETALRSVDAAEGALRRGDVRAAWADATVASGILRRPLLSGEDGAWVEATRQHLSELLVRAYSCLHEVWRVRGNHLLAGEMARRTIELAPFRESGYRQLMSSLAAGGDRAEALRVYERCRTFLAEELGTDPAEQTQHLYTSLLR